MLFSYSENKIKIIIAAGGCCVAIWLIAVGLLLSGNAGNISLMSLEHGWSYCCLTLSAPNIPQNNTIYKKNSIGINCDRQTVLFSACPLGHLYFV